MQWNPQIQILGAVILAVVLGALIGIDRELADKPAGLRTHMFVAGTAALLVGLSDTLLHRLSSDMELVRSGAIRADPVLIISAIITGVSFLCAGTIIRREKGEHVEGLTTAASILLSAAVGISVGLHQIILAAGVAVLAIAILRGMRVADRWLDRRRASTKDKP